MANPFDEADENPFDSEQATETVIRAPKDARMTAVVEADAVRPGAPAEAPRERGLVDDVADYVNDAGDAFAKGAVSGATADFDDEIAGVVNGLTTGADEAQAERQLAYETTGETPGALDAYRGASEKARRDMRDSMRADKKAAEEAHPILYPTGQVAGAMLLPAGRVAKGASKLVSFGKGALTGGGLGALAGVGSSVKEGLDSLGDAVGPGAVGAIIGGPANAVATPLAKYFGALKARAQAKAAEAASEAFGKFIRPMRSAVGGEVSAGANSLKVLRDAVANGNLSPEVRAAAAKKLASREAAALEENVVNNTIDRFDERLPRIESTKAKLAEGMQRGTPEALDASKQEILSRPEMRSRLWSIGKDLAMPAAGYLLGDELGGHKGAAAGTGVGALLTSLMKPGRRLRNAAVSPAFRSALGTAGEYVAERTPAFATQAASTAAPTSGALAEYLRLLQEKDTP